MIQAVILIVIALALVWIIARSVVKTYFQEKRRSLAAMLNLESNSSPKNKECSK